MMKRIILLAALAAGLAATAEKPNTIPPFKPGERVLFYGDSITHGGGYIYYLQLFENLRHPGSGVRFLNGGRSGGSAWTGIVNLERELKDSRPTRAIVMFGMNDISRDRWMDEVPNAKDRAAREKALANMRKNLTTLVQRFEAAGIRPVLMTPTPFDQYSKFDFENIPCCNEPGASSAAEIVRDIVREKRLGMVELYAPLTKLLREGTKGYIFCRDRVHPGNEGQLLIAAHILNDLCVSPNVDSVSVDAGSDADSFAFDYAPKALPFPLMPEYETDLAFYPLTERLNREIVQVRGLRPGRYALAFDGKRVGAFSAEELATGVNVALLPTPNQLRARELVPTMRKLHKMASGYRNVILVRRMIEDAKVDPDDWAAADAWLDKWLEGEKSKPYYLGEKAWADGFRAGRATDAATRAEIDGLYEKLAAVRPVASRITVSRLPEPAAQKAVRGPARLADVAALPVVDLSARTGYVGSIDPSGYNADWSWGEVQDERGEWILFEDEGAGCIFNFTQHRAVNSAVEVPVFRFYFDGEAKPRLTARPEDFGRTAALPAPLAGAQEKVRDGEVRFRIVRSFVPMAYTNGCRITSSSPLRYKGKPTADGAFGPTEGGWGHVTYQHYPDAAGLKTYDPGAPCEATAGGTEQRRLTTEPKFGTVAAGAGNVLYDSSSRGTLVETSLAIPGFTRDDCTNLWLAYTFDGVKTVEAPLGTFFGCETPSGKPVKLETALLTFDTTDAKTARFSNRFPMPFFKSVMVTLENRGKKPRRYVAKVVNDPSLVYDPKTTGVFTATPYLPPTRNVARRNATVGKFVGRGAMAYGTITGTGYPWPLPKGVEWGVCEGDVRCFIDDMTAPRVQSDGSESWGSWGLGFEAPPQCSPYAAYDTPDGKKEWSQVRLLVGDTYNFKRFLRFDLEHGGQNDHPESFTSGQIFGYLLPKEK